jgi:hypothetical protein
VREGENGTRASVNPYAAGSRAILLKAGSWRVSMVAGDQVLRDQVLGYQVRL